MNMRDLTGKTFSYILGTPKRWEVNVHKDDNHKAVGFWMDNQMQKKNALYLSDIDDKAQ